MMVYSIVAIEYPQECTNHDEHDKHGSGEPVNKALLHYTTSYIQCLWCDITGPRNNTQFTLLFLCFHFIWTHWMFAKFTCHKTPPNWCAGKACQNNPPKQSAATTCRTQVRLQPAVFTRQKQVRFQPAVLTCQRTPLPPAAPRNGGGGGGGRLTRLAYASWTGTLPFIPLTWTIYMSHMIQHIAFYTERINEWKFNYIYCF